MRAGVGVGGFEPVPGAFAEGPAEEAELEGDQDGFAAADAGRAGDDGLLLAGPPCGAGAGLVVPGPAERAVGGRIPVGRGEFREAAGVGHGGDGRAGRETGRHASTLGAPLAAPAAAAGLRQGEGDLQGVRRHQAVAEPEGPRPGRRGDPAAA